MADEPNFDFSFYVRGIEDGILAILKDPMAAIGVNVLVLYTGQLDDLKALEDAISQQTLKYPFVMVSYAGGASDADPVASEVMGEPVYERHDCGFSIIVADDNPQGEGQRRNKLYDMASVVWDTLVGVRLTKDVDGQPITLNTTPFRRPEHVPLVLPNATGLGIMFEIAFEWESPDRTETAPTGRRIRVEIDSKWPGLAESDTEVPPGVEMNFS